MGQKSQSTRPKPTQVRGLEAKAPLPKEGSAGGRSGLAGRSPLGLRGAVVGKGLSVWV